MNDPAQDSQATRWSFLARLKNWEDQKSWREFLDTWRLLNHKSLRLNLLALSFRLPAD
jgi:hypothetical protein